MVRTSIDVDRSATILDVADRIRTADGTRDIVLVAAAGAPWLRNAVFFEVARRLAEPRRLAVVTSDQRARTLAAGVHVPAYSSVTALERHELDATERLVRPRGARAGPQATRLRAPALTRSALAVAASLAAAVLLVAGVVLPQAVVTVAPATQPVGPLELQLRAGPGGEIARGTLSETITVKIRGAASGSREELTKARGSVVLSNRQTQSARIAKGTSFRTPEGVRFVTTEERTLPPSVIFFPLTLTVGTVEIPVEAADAGRSGNVPAGRITVGPAPADYTVTNQQATTGGDVQKIPVIEQRDYDAARARAAGEVHAAAEARLARWRSEPRPGMMVVERVYSALTSLTPAADVVTKEQAEFELTATGTATAFEVPSGEPRDSAMARLRDAVLPGYGLDEPSTQVVATLLPDPEGTGAIAWAVRVSGSQVARVNTDTIRRALAGRSPDEAASILEQAQVRLVAMERSPSWWPRLPLLDSRILVPATTER